MYETPETPKPKKRFPKKTSTVPTRVYKFGLLPPTVNADRVDAIFAQTRYNYNQLITAERRARDLYRKERRRLFPKYAESEDCYQALDARLETLREQINTDKGRRRTRKVDPELAAEVERIKSEKKLLAETLKTLRAEIRESDLLSPISERLREEVAVIKRALRPTIYWGTYQLYEAAFKQACKSHKDPNWNTLPPHRLKTRIGVQIQGGMSIAELASNTQLQVTRLPEFHVRPSGRVFARGKAARTTLRIRIESDEKNHPVWAEFPMIMHRPFPEDTRIMAAYVTRQPHSVRVPFRYAVCFVIESRSFAETAGGERPLGEVAINFGWRQLPDDGLVAAPKDLAAAVNNRHMLRVATVNSSTAGLTEIRLPAWVRSYDGKVAELESLIKLQFNAARDALVLWMKTCTTAPEGFVETFKHVAKWESAHRLAEWVWYWREHRFVGDAEIYELLAVWLERHRHLGDWVANARQRILRWRSGFYREHACRLAKQASRIVADAFDIADVAKKPKPEKQKKGGPVAEHNRQLAAVGNFRLTITQACARFGCEFKTAPTTNSTRRCNVCGELYEWDPAQELVHTCPGIETSKEPCSTWDQDVNNTDNVLDRLASGEVSPIVEPAQRVVNADGFEEVQPGKTHSWSAARASLRKLLKIE